MNVTKASIKAAYIANLKRTYAFYVEGSRPLALAHEAADKALSGTMKLKGKCWDDALVQHNLHPSTPMRVLAALPAGEA